MKTNKKVEKEQNLKLLVEVTQFTSKKGLVCYSGTDKDNNKFIGYTNTTKKNDKEPDIRFYVEDEKEEVFCLWKQTAKSGTIYLSGKTNEDERIVGFIDTDTNKIRIYYSLEKKTK